MAGRGAVTTLGGGFALCDPGAPPAEAWSIRPIWQPRTLTPPTTAPAQRARALALRLSALGVVAILSLLAPSAVVAASGNHFSAGYCTWQAAELANRTWGVWIPWFGDAGDWAGGAAAAGWTVSQDPKLDSIAVMPRGVQGSGRAGHVGWVVDVDADGSGVTLLSMNWSGYGVVSRHHVSVDGLVSFVTPPTSDAHASDSAGLLLQTDRPLTLWHVQP